MNGIICKKAPFLNEALVHSPSKVVVLDFAAIDRSGGPEVVERTSCYLTIR